MQIHSDRYLANLLNLLLVIIVLKDRGHVIEGTGHASNERIYNADLLLKKVFNG